MVQKDNFSHTEKEKHQRFYVSTSTLLRFNDETFIMYYQPKAIFLNEEAETSDGFSISF